MSLQALRDQFVGEVPSGRIPVDAGAIAQAGLTPPTGLDKLLTGAFMLSSGTRLTILKPTNISAIDNNAFTVTGSIDTPLAKADGVTARFTTAGNTAVFQIVVPLAPGWKFKDSFRYVAGKVADGLPLQNAYFAFSTDEQDSYPVGGGPIALAPGLNFAADITLTDILARILDLFGGLAPNLPRRLTGPLDPSVIGTKTKFDIPIITPAMDLRADLGIGTYTFAFLTLQNPFVRYLTRDYGPKYAPSPALTVDAGLQVDGGNPVTFEATLPSSGETYSFAVFGDKGGLILSPRQLFDLMAGRTWYDVIPPALLQFLGDFGPKMFSADLVVGDKVSVTAVSAQVGSDPNKKWELLDGLFVIDGFDAWWTILSPLDQPVVTATFATVFEFGANSPLHSALPGKFRIAIDTNLVVAGSYIGTADFGDIVAAATNNAVQVPKQFKLEFADISLRIDPRGNSYSLAGETTLVLNLFGDNKFGIENARFDLATFPSGSSGNPAGRALVASARDANGNTYSASIKGALVLGPVYLDASLAYRSGLWTASIGTQPGEVLSLQKLIDAVFAAVNLPVAWFDIGVSVENLLLAAEIQTGTTGRNLYKASGDFTWHFQIGSASFDPIATLTLQYDSSQKIQPYTGSVDAIIQFQLFGVGALFGVRYAIENDQSGKPKESIALTWQDLVAAYEKSGAAQKITFTVGPGWSLGRLVTMLVRLIAPSAVRNLPPPWDLLDQVSLSGLKIVFELDTKKVTVSWPIKLDLFFLTLQSIDLVKEPGQQVTVTLKGSYLGDKPIPAWDAVKQDPPEVPGGGSSAFDLRLLAVGQRVTIAGLDRINTVGDAVDALKAFAQPAPDSKKVPVGTHPASGEPIYSADNNLLLGAHFLALAGAIEIKLIFNDPVLYGLRINLSGDKVGPFKGLQFEILYKKVTDTIGVYKIMLKLPDQMRYLQFGQVTVILPIIGVDIYTNGDFKIDFGFPYKLDFSRSFTVQVFPFTGSGGFYFAKLSGATSNSVPKTDKGTFNPVIEFGFGLQVGFGKSLSLGILKAEISITIFGLIEGVIAAWRPYSSASPLASPDARRLPSGNALVPQGANARALAAAGDDTQYYYWIRGTIGLLGKINGVVDFAIVKAEINIEVRAFIQVTFEAYAEVQIYLEAGVTVSISLSINLGFFKITINLSFSATVRESFIIGTDRRKEAPWYSGGALGLEFRPPRQRFSRLHAAALFAAAPDFAPLATPASGTSDLQVYFLPQPTVYTDTPENRASQVAALVATSFMQSPGAQSAAGATSFEQLTRDVFLWVGSSFRGAGTKPTPDDEAKVVYSRPQLMAALEFLAANASGQPFTYQNVADFIAALFKLVISEPPKTADAAATGPNGTVFPIIPGLHLKAEYKQTVLADVDFSAYGMVDGDYLKQLADSIDLLVAKYLDELERKHGEDGTPALRRAAAIDRQSLAQFIFVDYFVMLARFMLQEAIDILNAYAYPLDGGGAPDTSLALIIGYINGLQPGGANEAAVANLVTYADVGEANRDHPLVAGKDLAISGVRIQLQQPRSLGDIASIYRGVTAGGIAAANADKRGVLNPAATVVLNGTPYPIGPNGTFATLAQASGLSPEAVGEAMRDDADVIAALALFDLPPVNYTTSSTPDTLGLIAAAYGVSPASLAFDVRTVSGLFDDKADGYLVLPELNCLPAGSLLADMAVHGSAQHLSGLAARYLLHGLRIWTKGVGYPGAAPFDASEDEAALYRLMGQRVTVPDLSGYQDADPLTLTLTNPQDLAWVTLIDPATNAPRPSLPFKLPKDGADWLSGLLAQAKAPGLKAPIVSVSESLDAKRREKTFSFKSRIDLQAASAIALPVGAPSADPGVPTLALWTFPDALTSAILDHQTAALAAGVPLDAVVPYRFAPKASVRAIPNRPPQIVDIAHWGYAALIDVEIKRSAATDRTAATVPTYDLVGTDQAGEKLLESLLARITPTNTMAIRDVLIVYRPNQASDRTSGLQYDGEDHYKAFLIRANLSTETNPPTGALPTAADFATARTTGILNDTYDFISAVWQASVVRSGGFSLSYQLADGNGFPDAIFDQNGSGQIGLLILYAESGGDALPMMNAVITGDAIDPSATSVYAQSVARSLKGISTAGKSIAQIADAYGVFATDVALAAGDKALAPLTLRITDIVTQVQPGDTLAVIAGRFGVTDTAIRDLNPNPHIDWSNLVAGTGLAIPDIDVATAAGGTDTLASLARKYSSQVAAIGYANRARAGIFAAGVTIDLDQVILEKQSQVPPGNAGLTLMRTNPGDDSKQPAVYLEQDYGLLGYDVVANANFAPLADSLGLPAGPADDQTEEQLKALRRPSVAALRALASGNDWTFKLVVPSSRLATVHAPVEPGKPDPMLNPYAGVGGFIQLDLEWRDFFGDLTSSPFTDPTIDPTYPLNFTPLRVLYTDPVIGLGQWPSTECDYLYAKGAGGPQLQIALAFNTSRYQPAPATFQPLADPRAEGELEDWQKNAMADRQVFANAYYQLDQSGPAPARVPSVVITAGESVKGAADTELSPADRASLKAYVAGAWAYLDALLAPAANATPQPPAPVTLTLATAATFAGDIAQVRVAVTMRRVEAQVAAEFRDYPAAVMAATAISPHLTKQAGGGYTLDDFAKSFEEAFAGSAGSLKLATGEDAQLAGRPAASDASLWAVRMAAPPRAAAAGGDGFAYAIAGKPVFYAPAPLSTELISSETPIKCYGYSRENGLSPTPTEAKTFNGIDLDQWASIMLGAIDLLLQPRYAIPTFAVDWLGNTGYQAKILKAKYDLAGEIVTGVTNILTDPPVSPQTDKDAFDDAREKLRQQLLIQLANAYDVDAIVQHKVDVASGGAGPAAPRLYGQPAAKLATAPERTRPLRGLAAAPDNASFSTSSFKFALAQGTVWLSYPFRAKSAASQRDFALDIAYNPTQIEHQIAAVPGIDGYVASSWLGFVKPLPPVPVGGGDPQVAVDVPVVLRAYPTPPSMQAQEAHGLSVDATGATERLREAKGWNYDFLYAKQRVAQDRIHAQVHFNIPKGVRVSPLAEEDDVNLFVALARFTTVYPQIQQTFDQALAGIGLGSDKGSTVFKQAALALDAFTRLIRDIGDIWKRWVAAGSHATDLAALRDSEVQFNFIIDETPVPYGGVTALMVTIRYTDPLPPNMTSPELVFDGYRPAPPPVAADAGGAAGDGVVISHIYLDDHGNPLPYDTVADRRARFAALDAIQYQNAWSSLQITRNDLLVEGNPTRQPFIYTTPWVSFRNKLAPRLATDATIPIEQVPTDAPQTRTMLGHLEALFDAFFYQSAVEQQTIKLEVTYSFVPGDIATLPPVTIPVLLVPAADYVVPRAAAAPAAPRPRRRAAIGNALELSALAETLRDWFHDNHVSRAGGTFNLSLTAFSALELNTQPLVQVPALTLDISYVNDLD